MQILIQIRHLLLNVEQPFKQAKEQVDSIHWGKEDQMMDSLMWMKELQFISITTMEEN